MPAPYAVAMMRVRVSTTVDGTYKNVGFVRSADYSRAREGSTTIRWFGGDQARPGSKTLSGSMPVWFDREDTDGQVVLRAAYENDTPVYLQFCPEGTEASAKADQFEAVIDEVGFSVDSEGEAAEGSFSFTGSPSTFQEVTLT